MLTTRRYNFRSTARADPLGFPAPVARAGPAPGQERFQHQDCECQHDRKPRDHSAMRLRLRCQDRAAGCRRPGFRGIDYNLSRSDRLELRPVQLVSDRTPTPNLARFPGHSPRRRCRAGHRLSSGRVRSDEFRRMQKPASSCKVSFTVSKAPLAPQCGRLTHDDGRIELFQLHADCNRVSIRMTGDVTKQFVLERR